MTGNKQPGKIIPPFESDKWERKSLYLIEVSWFKGNPIHREFLYTGFHSDSSEIVGVNYDEHMTRVNKHNVRYLKMVRKLVGPDELYKSPIAEEEKL